MMTWTGVMTLEIEKRQQIWETLQDQNILLTDWMLEDEGDEVFKGEAEIPFQEAWINLGVRR